MHISLFIFLGVIFIISFRFGAGTCQEHGVGAGFALSTHHVEAARSAHASYKVAERKRAQRTYVRMLTMVL